MLGADRTVPSLSRLAARVLSGLWTSNLCSVPHFLSASHALAGAMGAVFSNAYVLPRPPLPPAPTPRSSAVRQALSHSE